jgi:hypothetical protein
MDNAGKINRDAPGCFTVGFVEAIKIAKNKVMKFEELIFGGEQRRKLWCGYRPEYSYPKNCILTC